MTSQPEVGSEFWVELPFPIASESSRAVAPSGPMSTVTVRRLPGVRVLIADDSLINLEVARRVLELEGAVATLASNGQEAVDHLVANPGAFDVVLMDIQMPVLDGYDATRRIRSGLGLVALPIIALTAGTLSSEQQLATAAGVSDFVTKPFEPHMLVRCIRRHVQVEDELSVDGAGADRSSASTWPEIEGIDSNDVARRLRGDVALFRMMLGRLLDPAQEPGGADADGALERLASQLHSIRGSAGTLGATAAARFAAEGEAACREGDAKQGAVAAALLATELRRLRGAAEPVLARLDAQVADLDAGQTEDLDPQALVALLQLLRESNLDAVERFTALSPQLRRRLGAGTYAVVREQVDSLCFDDAVRALERLAS